MSGSKTRYLEFCREMYVPLHLQAWWLDAVCGPNAWDVALAPEQQGIPMAAMPWFKTRFWGLPVIRQAPFTAYGGPWFHTEASESESAWKILENQHRLMRKLIEQLPRVAYFRQCFRPEIQNWLPFHWAGFRQTTRYTYVLPDTSNLSLLYAGLKNTIRTDLRHAAQLTETIETKEPDEIFKLNKLSFRRKGLQQPYVFSVFKKLHNALAERQQAIIWLALDRKSELPHAGLYLVFDSRQAAVLLTGLDPQFSYSGALNGLYWQAIQFCAARKLSLDFEGSMQEGIERVFRAFGGQRTPYFQIWRIC